MAAYHQPLFWKAPVAGGAVLGIYFAETPNIFDGSTAYVPSGPALAMRNTWLSQVTPLGYITFSGLPVDGLSSTTRVYNFKTSLTGSVNTGDTATFAALPGGPPNSLMSIQSNGGAYFGGGAGRWNTTPMESADPDLDKWLEYITGLSVTFSTPCLAFGFYAVDWGDFLGVVTITVSFTTEPDQTFEIVDSSSAELIRTDGNLMFWGFISNVPVTKITIRATGNDPAQTDVYGFDDLIIATA